MSRPRTPLLRPQSYFQAHDGSPPLGDAMIAVLVVAVVTAGGVGLFLSEFDRAVDATVTMDNPEHVPEWACENYAESDISTPSGCHPSVPETVERDVGSLVVEKYSWLPLVVLLFVPVLWVFQGAVLHGASALFDGKGTFSDTLAVAGWGMVPSVTRMLAIGALLVYQLRTTTFPGSTEGAVAALEAAFAGLSTISLVATAVVAVWAGAVRVYGLASAREITTGEAFWIVLASTLVGLLFEAV
ncbi:YIP1 family protein [Halorarum halophilum]|uniref:YIP1 family protein n=1 Tax=Halorarum halophilum TaxID=2743090 RepID=A0A7D5KF81_9EURY|nr:Yip1 family protein [Halobaculum halophilum]QLG28757.1 YIP1 family protein [Halobaculum halophilum]